MNNYQIPETLLNHQQDHKDIQPSSELVPYDENLLERARTQWQFGDWESLTELDKETLQHHPDRAKLALLAAAGHLQTGNPETARQFIRLAQNWGISKKLLTRILTAGVHNSLGRAAVLMKQKPRALQHFESAIAIGTPGSAIALVANARANHELGILQEHLALADSSNHTDIPTHASGASTVSPTSKSHIFYIQLGETFHSDPIPFLLIDSKSLPRSGLHYLKNTLSKIFGEHFSFCEWYHEPGCCKNMPCSLTGFAMHAKETGQLRIRLTKSHDFHLTDPVYQTNRYLRRLILIRDPIFILTSWFALDQLNAHASLLLENGIDIKKIFLSHEEEVIKPAFQCIDDHFNPPDLMDLNDWLEDKSRYISGFMNKWVTPLIDSPDKNTQILHYEEINQYIKNLYGEFQANITTEVNPILSKKTVSVAIQGFKKRKDPFWVPSKSISDYLFSNSSIFKAYADKLMNLGFFS